MVRDTFPPPVSPCHRMPEPPPSRRMKEWSDKPIREGSSLSQVKGSNPDNPGGRPPAPPEPPMRKPQEQIVRVIHEFAECTCPNCGTKFKQESP